jgi:hypothetical protein
VAVVILAATFAGTATAQPCANGRIAGEVGSLHGTVRDARGIPLVGAGVVASWQTWAYSDTKLSEGVHEATAVTGPDGRYQLCAIPTRVRVTVSASAGRSKTDPATVLLRDNSSIALDLSLGSAAATLVTVPRGSITGTVRDSEGAPILGVRFTVAGSDVAALSTEAGRFDLGGLASGEHVVTARRIGYRPESERVRVGEASGSTVAFVLTTVAVPLSEVVAVAPMSAFELASGFGERRRRGPGVFFDRADLERRRPHNLTDVFRMIPGFHIQPALTRWGSQSTPTMTRANTGSRVCQIDYYVNGHEFSPTSMGIDSDIPPHQIEAIEVYKPSEIPPQFLGKRSRCGVVVIWTRYRAHELTEEQRATSR